MKELPHIALKIQENYYFIRMVANWDKNNNQMPNGFGIYGGSSTSTQAALIIPKPNSTNLFYFISSDQGGTSYYIKRNI